MTKEERRALCALLGMCNEVKIKANKQDEVHKKCNEMLKLIEDLLSEPSTENVVTRVIEKEYYPWYQPYHPYYPWWDRYTITCDSTKGITASSHDYTATLTSNADNINIK